VLNIAAGEVDASKQAWIATQMQSKRILVERSRTEVKFCNVLQFKWWWWWWWWWCWWWWLQVVVVVVVVALLLLLLPLHLPPLSAAAALLLLLLPPVLVMLLLLLESPPKLVESTLLVRAAAHRSCWKGHLPSHNLFPIPRSARAVDERSGHSLLECAVFECRELQSNHVEITIAVRPAAKHKQLLEGPRLPSAIVKK
jgi:hypothetical protein